MIYIIAATLLLASCSTQQSMHAPSEVMEVSPSNEKIEMPQVPYMEEVVVEGEDPRLPFVSETRLRMEEDYRASVQLQTTMINTVHDHPLKERLQYYINVLLEDIAFMEDIETVGSQRHFFTNELSEYTLRRKRWEIDSSQLAKVLTLE